MSIPLIAALVIGGVVLVALFLWASFVSASPGEIKVISGPRGQRVLHGKTGWKVPLLERVDSMTASMISVDAQTTDFVPTNDYINVRVDAAVKVRIATDDPTLFRAATRNFLYKETREISEEVRDTLEGHLRAIIGQMRLTDIITDRAAFSERVQENAKLDLEEMGLEIVAFNIQNVMDQNGVIDNLGIDNTEQIRKTAAIAKANAQKEVAQATAVAEKEANDAQVASQLEIAQKQTDLAKRQAALKVEADTEKAKADATKPENIVKDIVEARRVLNRTGASKVGRILLVGSDWDAILQSSKELTAASVGDGVAETAFEDAYIGKIKGFTVVTSEEVDPGEAYALTGGAFVFLNAAPAVPDSVVGASAIAQDGVAMRWIKDYDATHLMERSIVNTWYGFQQVVDPVVYWDAAKKTEVVSDAEYGIRAIKLALDGTDSYFAEGSDKTVVSKALKLDKRSKATTYVAPAGP